MCLKLHGQTIGQLLVCCHVYASDARYQCIIYEISDPRSLRSIVSTLWLFYFILFHAYIRCLLWPRYMTSCSVHINSVQSSRKIDDSALCSILRTGQIVAGQIVDGR